MSFQVARDRVVKGWNFAENLGDVDTGYGSGYPNGNNPQLSIYLSVCPLYLFLCSYPPTMTKNSH